ncbi:MULTISPECIES: peptidoglycan DD-metalloendopeptidase family protein [unclassified Legionella]|uniref:peptidoglycan DD-metalloendopeptidase family protein n=1 Tax=unclassified Legionella TaxID=2622702 RepID=UPI001E545625|nr:peptidoglycan DD-metalloendopeptidase family protein [Legionella sp. 31fI33]MCC5014908.1 peptidoglycan DD-metalloendopeptidase family protein [Legionella sp. 31fI33]
MYKLCVFLSALLLTGCGSRSDLAPVVELKWQPQNPNQTTHRVLRGETLYAVAFRYDQDYRQLAALNHLHSPYALRVGQIIRLQGASRTPARHYYHAKTKPVYTARNIPSARPVSPSYQASWARPGRYQSWLWPVNGRVATQFIPQQGKKGIDIAGMKGEKIRASSGGVVAYAGSGLSGYGNLIIIKHNNQFLTAYGNNLRNMVHEGQQVKAGQVIAEMGVVDRRFWGVHFEIRRAGKPVNPLNYLQKG